MKHANIELQIRRTSVHRYDSALTKDAMRNEETFIRYACLYADDLDDDSYYECRYMLVNASIDDERAFIISICHTNDYVRSAVQQVMRRYEAEIVAVHTHDLIAARQVHSQLIARLRKAAYETCTSEHKSVHSVFCAMCDNVVECKLAFCASKLTSV